MEKFTFLSKDNIDGLPKSPGVYCFKSGNKFLYIGKSSNIRDRVKNHLRQPDWKDNLFLSLIGKTGYIKTDSEIEALILEAKLIKKFQPKYNIMWRDDKNYLFVGIAKNKYPWIFITHQPEKKKELNIRYIGPFVDGKALKQTLKTLRKVFPYYTREKHSKLPCSWCHIDLCPGPNPNKKEYGKNIKNLIAVLEGKRQSVLKKLKKEMSEASRSQNFETALKIRNQIWSLEKIMSHAKIFREIEEKEYLKRLKRDFKNGQKIAENELKKILGTKKKVSRIEAYDISDIQGAEATGSMVTFIDNKPDKNYYRRFKIRITGKPNDIAMIKEMLFRRLRHREWGLPDLILIDGGRGQFNAAQLIAGNEKLTIPVAALAKKNNELFLKRQKKPLLLKNMPREIFNVILQLRDEAHRFARGYHHELRKTKTFNNPRVTNGQRAIDSGNK